MSDEIESRVLELKRKIDSAEEAIILLGPTCDLVTKLAPRSEYAGGRVIYPEVPSVEAENAMAKIGGYKDLIALYREELAELEKRGGK